MSIKNGKHKIEISIITITTTIMTLRLVNRVEQSVMSYRLSTMLSFETTTTSKTTEVKRCELIEAVRACKRKYPYLRMRIVRDKNDDSPSGRKWWFMEQHDTEIDNIDSSIATRTIEHREEFFDKWSTRLNEFANKPMNVSVSVFSLELHRLQTTNNYQLFFGLNHSGK